MTPQVKHFALLFTILAAASACGNDQCEENPDLFICGISAEDETGETGSPTDENVCAPFNPDDPKVGYTYACQGQGNGWLTLEIIGKGDDPLPPECVNWGPEGKPESDEQDPITTDDCIPVELTMLPDDIPSPEACCVEDAMAGPVTDQCAEDCGYAACKLAVSKLRAAADALPEDGAGDIEKKAQERVKGDLNAFAATLEAPAALAYCAQLVTEADGELTVLDLHLLWQQLRGPSQHPGRRARVQHGRRRSAGRHHHVWPRRQ